MADTLEHLDATHQTSDLHPAESLRTYYVIFAWLMGLLVLTVAVSLVNLDRFIPGLNFIVAMLIAVTKGAMVMLVFMHVRKSSKLTWIFATAAFLWLGIMFLYSFSDYGTRAQMPEASITTPDHQRAPVLEHVDKKTDAPVSHD